MRAHQASYRVTTLCRVLAVSTSGYYAWLKREPSAHAKRDLELAVKIKQSHERSKGTYGRPRVHEDLKESGTSEWRRSA